MWSNTKIERKKKRNTFKERETKIKKKRKENKTKNLLRSEVVIS